MRELRVELGLVAAFIVLGAIVGSTRTAHLRALRASTAERAQLAASRVATARDVAGRLVQWRNCMQSSGALTSAAACPGRAFVRAVTVDGARGQPAKNPEHVSDGDDASLWCTTLDARNKLRLAFSEPVALSGLRLAWAVSDTRNRKQASVRGVEVSYEGGAPLSFSLAPGGGSGEPSALIELEVESTSHLDVLVTDAAADYRGQSFCLRSVEPLGKAGPAHVAAPEEGSFLLGMGARPPRFELEGISKPQAPTAVGLVQQGNTLAESQATMQQALALYVQATELDPRFAYAHYRAAYCHYRLGDTGNASLWADKAEALADGQRQLMSNIECLRGRVAEIEKRWEDARAQYAKALELYAKNDWALVARGTMQVYLDPSEAFLSAARKLLAAGTLEQTDIEELSRDELRALRNGVLARHRVNFNDVGLNRLYYEPPAAERLGLELVIDPLATKNKTTRLDQTNVALIKKREKELDSGGATQAAPAAAATRDAGR